MIPVKTPTFKTKHPTYHDDMFEVRVRSDVAAHIKPVPGGTAALTSAVGRSGMRAFTLPESLESPFEGLRVRGLIEEVIPVHAPAPRPGARPRGSSIPANAVARSLHDVTDDALRGVNIVRLTPGASAKEIARELAGIDGVEYVDRVPTRWLCTADPLRVRQWGLSAIGWLQPAIKHDATKVNVAILDTGIDVAHPDLHAASYHHDGATAEDIIGHGTHVAGIIGATADNGIGIAGVCATNLHIWKIFGDVPTDGDFYVDPIMFQRALNDVRLAAGRDATRWVMNLSIGGSGSSQTEARLFRRVIEANVVVCAAMGNEYEEGNPIEYPGAYEGVIAIGAIDQAGRRAPFSNTGDRIAICAPGVDILSTLPLKPSSERQAADTKYAAWSGTSMATPHVTGAVALLLQAHPSLTPAETATHLKEKAAKVADMNGETFTSEFGAGCLDLPKLLG